MLFRQYNIFSILFMSAFSLHNILLASSMVHLVLTAVMALFARHKVQYLSLAWIVGIFAVAVTAVIPFVDLIESTRPAMLHPGTLVGLMGFLYLQSIYPLGITMPGFLQWERMWRYALPIFVLTVLYGFFSLLGMTSPNYYTWEELGDAFFTIDMFLRLAMLGVGIYYIINIIRLPQTRLRYPHVPGYIMIYAFVLGISSFLYIWLILRFTVAAFEVWVVIFTLANIYMCLRTLETIAVSLPKPEIKVIEQMPVEVQAEEDEEEDFNEANLQRFQTLEYWMQHNHEAWKEYTFGRDQLCTETGINRHLTLQCVRSQGYNNIHDYINAYRISELQRMISYGEVTCLRDCLDAGFGTIKTARSSFERITGKSLDEVLEQALQKK